MNKVLSITIISNPVAGGGGQKKLLDGVIQYLKSNDTKIDILETQYAGHERELASTVAKDQPDIVIAAGGDGTVNEIAGALLGSEITMAVIPMGTVNLLAKELNLPEKAEQLAAVILAGKKRKIFPGIVNNHLFLVTASIGFDADVVANFSAPLKKIIGKAAYGLQALKQWVTLKPCSFTVQQDTIDAQIEGLLVAKGRYYAGSFSWAKQASVFDDKLYACLQKSAGRLATCTIILKLALGRSLETKTTTLKKIDKLTVTTPKGRPVQGDGDIITHTPAVFSTSKTPMIVIVP